MLFTLIVAAAAGAATPYIEDRVTEAMARALGEARMPDAAGRRAHRTTSRPAEAR